MKNNAYVIPHITLTEQMNHAFFYAKGYDAFANLKSNHAGALFDVYLAQNKSFASAITQQQTQVSFISSFSSPVSQAKFRPEQEDRP